MSTTSATAIGSGTVTSTSSVTGLASGFNWSSLITAIMDQAEVPITNLQTKGTELNNKISAWQDVDTRLLAVKTALDTLSDPKEFNVVDAASSNEDILTATASTDATEGTYYVTVNSLARSEQQASQGFADKDTTTVGTGKISIATGTGTAISIDITDSNNTLEGLRQAINGSNAGVKATIINDGSSSPYRLLLTSDTGGTAGAMTITSNLSGGTAPAFTTMQAAQDASVTLGSGTGAVTITKSSNTITDLIPGVTLNLVKADTTNPITVSISQDTDQLKKDITTFVTQYNNLMDEITSQFTFDPTTEESGALFGDSTLQSIKYDLTNKIFTLYGDSSSTLKALAQIGISTSGNSTRLKIDEDTLDKALENNLDDLKSMFSTVGSTTGTGVTFLSNTADTKASSSAGYVVNITQVATHARVTAGVAQTGALASDETITLNGQTIALSAGLTQAQVAAKINEYSNKTGVIASATGADGTGTGDYLTLSRANFGTAGTISVSSSSSNGSSTTTSGIGNVTVTESDYDGESGTGTGAEGQNVAGTINGEAATGIGQVLTGNDGNSTTTGLSLEITATTTGNIGNVILSKGLASQVSDYLSFITDEDDGTIATAIEAMQDKITYMNEEIEDLTAANTRKQDALTIKYAAMEATLSSLQSTGDSLTSSIKSLTKSSD